MSKTNVSLGLIFGSKNFSRQFSNVILFSVPGKTTEQIGRCKKLWQRKFMQKLCQLIVLTYCVKFSLVETYITITILDIDIFICKDRQISPYKLNIAKSVKVFQEPGVESTHRVPM